MEHAAAEGDAYRLARTRDAAVRDWVRRAVQRARQAQVVKSYGRKGARRARAVWPEKLVNADYYRLRIIL